MKKKTLIFSGLILLSVLAVLYFSKVPILFKTESNNPDSVQNAENPGNVKDTKNEEGTREGTQEGTSEGTAAEEGGISESSGEVAFFSAPLDRAEERITKKTFGMFVTPETSPVQQTSPVQPEKFRGFHTGTDWEVFPGELNENVAVQAVCSGTLIIKRSASGYGGVVVEECELDGDPVTIIYGHLDLKSVAAETGENILAGNTIGLLGAHRSGETDGARKHLHLGVHRGKNIELKGYVSSARSLQEWIDPCLYFC